MEENMTISEALGRVRAAIEGAEAEADRPAGSVTLIAVSKTFPEADVRTAIAAGQLVFGENRVKEAASKFPAVKADFPALELHLIGPLQSNKAHEAVALFDVIHSVDRERIAAALAKEMQAQSRFPKLLVQVNTGEEPQKAGVAPRETVDFVKRCREVHGLTIAGLMCIPPVGDPPAPHFALLDELARRAGVAFRSMGMSSDYETAIGQGATHVRVGSAIFGYRDYGAA
jgi:PLP dependent protein